MRYIWHHLRAFIAEDFQPRRYGLAALWMALLMGVNYYLDWEDAYLSPRDGTWEGYGLYLLTYGLAYLPVLALAGRSSGKMWGAGLLALAILSTDTSLSIYKDFAAGYVDKPYYVFLWKVTQQLQSLLTILLPLAVLYAWLRPMPGFYGLRLGPSVKMKPYLLMLAIMVIPVLLAAQTAGFQETYPNWQYAFQWPQERGRILLYELCYGWDFVATELLFRGFFVIALARFGGPRIVLAATSVYCALHFGKPVGECVSSVFGGYLLGAMAYRTGNIWGGIIVHLGIAFLMDAAALAVRLL